MLALSLPMFPNLGWPLEDQELVLDQKLIWPVEDVPFPSCHIRRERTMSSDSLPNFSSSPREVCNEGIDALDDPSAFKKLSHNANERDRRKKLNTLYYSLRALLPKSDHPSKLSIPGTVSRVLKYIPELQKQVERLEKRKAEMLSKLSSTNQDIVEQIHCTKRRRDEPRVVLPSPSIVASHVGDKEMVIQIGATDVRNSTLSHVLQKLEDEGLQVLSASTFTAAGERVVYTLQLQAKGTGNMDCGMLKEKLLCFYSSKSFELYQ